MGYKEMWCRGPFFTFLLIYFMDNASSFLRRCELSLATKEKVASCPSSEDEQIKSAKDKNCEQYWWKNTCHKDRTNFHYHCVINIHGNETIEVCSPMTLIHGYCTEFNDYGAVIQANYEHDCTKFDPPCKDQYKSTEAYLYKPCYNFSELFKNESSLKRTVNTTTSEKQPMKKLSGASTTEKPTMNKFSEGKEIHSVSQHYSSGTSRWWIGIVGDVCIMTIILAAMGLLYFSLKGKKQI